MIELKFKNPIPKNWNPESGIPQWADVSPDMKLPDDRAYINPPNNENWTIEQVMRKGLTHWSRIWGDKTARLRDDPAMRNKEYYDVPRIEQIFNLQYAERGGWDATGGAYNKNWWPNGPLSYDQAYQFGLGVYKEYGILIHEIWEGESYMGPDDSEMWRGYFDGLAEGYRRAGKTAKIGGNYFYRPGGDKVFTLGQASLEEHETLYSKPVSQWKQNMYSPGHAYQSTNLVMQEVYLNSPDAVARRIFEVLFNMEYLEKMGKESGIIPFMVHEWWPGFVTSIELPGGVMEWSDKMPIDPSIALMLPFIANEWGKTYVNWTGSGAFNPTDKRKLLDVSSWSPGKQHWFPNDANGEERPYNGFVGGNYYAPIPHPHNLDLSHFGIGNWNNLAAPYRNIPRQYCTYRVDGAPWVDRSPIGSDVVRAWFGKRRLACARVRDNDALFYTFDLFTDNKRHKLEVQNPKNPQQIWTGYVAGNGLEATIVQW